MIGKKNYDTEVLDNELYFKRKTSYVHAMATDFILP